MTDNPRVIRMTVEYDGSRYAGWQLQQNAVTVQQVVEQALSRHLGHAVRVTASGRTDSGVHAMGQVISFSTLCTMPATAMGRGAITHLPDDVTIRDAQDASPDFDARRDARLRWYRFFLCNRDVRPAVARHHLTHVPGALDMNRFRQAAAVLAGEHDFAGFRAASCTAARTRLNLHPIDIAELEDGIIRLDIRCRSFLQNMVRILAGTMVAAARGKMTTEDIARVLQSGVRDNRAVTIGPDGLFLWRVYYEEDLP